jgi:hypothetical protein
MEEKNKAWKTVSSKYLFRRPWLTVRCEDMLLPNGNHIPEYYILEYPDWVNTIAINKDNTRGLQKSYKNVSKNLNIEILFVSLHQLTNNLFIAIWHLRIIL